MNKVMLVGRFVRDPETQQTTSGIKYSRFTIAVDRPFGNNQADFIPVVAWRNQAEFVDNYLRKGALVAIEGAFSSSSYQKDGQNVTRYEVTADRISSLESKAQAAGREDKVQTDAASTQEIQFKNESKPEETTTTDVPWELDL